MEKSWRPTHSVYIGNYIVVARFGGEKCTNNQEFLLLLPLVYILQGGY